MPGHPVRCLVKGCNRAAIVWTTYAIRIIAIMELKQCVNEVRGYHGKQKKQLMTDSASLPERRRSMRDGADEDIPFGEALQGHDSWTLRPEARPRPSPDASVISERKTAPRSQRPRQMLRPIPSSGISPATEARATGARRPHLGLLDPSSPSFPRIAAGASVPPIAPYAPARFVQSDLASANGARQADLYRVFVASFIPRLKL